MGELEKEKREKLITALQAAVVIFYILTLIRSEAVALSKGIRTVSAARAKARIREEKKKNRAAKKNRG